MKKTFFIILGLSSAVFFTSCNTEVKEETATTQDSTAVHDVATVEVIKLNETPGAFDKTELKLKAGQEYSFEVKNDGIDKEVAFVLAPTPKEGASMDDIMATAIPDAMLTNYVNKDQTATSKVPITLEKGEYIYFCPLNGTPNYKVVVE